MIYTEYGVYVIYMSACMMVALGQLVDDDAIDLLMGGSFLLGLTGPTARLPSS